MTTEQEILDNLMAELPSYFTTMSLRSNKGDIRTYFKSKIHEAYEAGLKAWQAQYVMDWEAQLAEETKAQTTQAILETSFEKEVIIKKTLDRCQKSANSHPLDGG